MTRVSGLYIENNDIEPDCGIFVNPTTISMIVLLVINPHVVQTDCEYTPYSFISWLVASYWYVLHKMLPNIIVKS